MEVKLVCTKRSKLTTLMQILSCMRYNVQYIAYTSKKWLKARHLTSKMCVFQAYLRLLDSSSAAMSARVCSASTSEGTGAMGRVRAATLNQLPIHRGGGACCSLQGGVTCIGCGRLGMRKLTSLSLNALHFVHRGSRKAQNACNVLWCAQHSA